MGLSTTGEQFLDFCDHYGLPPIDQRRDMGGEYNLHTAQELRLLNGEAVRLGLLAIFVSSLPGALLAHSLFLSWLTRRGLLGLRGVRLGMLLGEPSELRIVSSVHIGDFRHQSVLRIRMSEQQSDGEEH